MGHNIEIDNELVRVLDSINIDELLEEYKDIFINLAVIPVPKKAC